MKWISVTERLPELGDYSVLLFGWPLPSGKGRSIDMGHVQDYFAPITCGLDEHGAQQYTQWYKSQGITHWMPLPPEPKEQP